MSVAPGWAIRRNSSCLVTQEVDCGETANGFRGCCPSSTTCPHQYNLACCEANTNCTTALVETPSCANSSWIMFDNNGYFCCEDGQVGYNLGNTDGCSRSGKALVANAQPLAVENQTFSSTSTSSTSASSTSTSTSISTSTSAASTSLSPTTSPIANNATSGGTIAGAVVGGIAGIAIIAGLAWFFIRKKKKASASRLPQTIHEAPGAPIVPGGSIVSGVPMIHEGNQLKEYYARSTTSPSEIGGTPKNELPVPSDRTEGRSEMPA
ncbi:hypothetical protein F4859DRAFT_519098 [Xylaria cf. heliscus]|nr:hypothetical protein F4859DRAFT_519098 [Xylaria cf. heliscus]